MQSDRNMKQKFKSAIEFQDEDIMAGYKFKMQYLGCGEQLKFGGTDHEIANVIHDIHTLYAAGNTKLSKARTVVVFVDAEKINLFNESEDEILLTFPLVYVKDVTTCLDQAPYSKTCVLVAKDYNDPLYKAFVFYCKTTARAAEFYHFTTSAFQLGFKRMENDSLNSASTANEESSTDSTPNGSFKKANGQLEEAKNDGIACLDDEDGECSTLSEFEKNCPESQKLLKSGIEHFQLKNKDQNHSKKSSQRQKAITVRFSDKANSFASHEKQEIKFNLNLGDANNNSNPSKMGAFVDTFGESSRYLIPHWFRNSYRKFRKMSAQRPAFETAEDV